MNLVSTRRDRRDDDNDDDNDRERECEREKRERLCALDACSCAST